MKKENSIKTFFAGDGIAILTENADREMYMLIAKSLEDIMTDWQGECESVPANDARVVFASRNGIPINPYCYRDFETLLMYLNGYGGQ